jgi:flagellar assembly factor FliW
MKGMNMKKQNETPQPMVLEPATRTVRIPVSDGNIFTFPDGVPAFEDYRQFVVYYDTQMQPFFFMKSLGVTPEVSFVCIDPFMICPDYQIQLERSDLQALDLKRGTDAFVFAIVTVNDDPCDITANLKGPIVLNMKNKRGRQVICEGSEHDVRYRVWDALSQINDDGAVSTTGTWVEPTTTNCLQPGIS